MAELKCLNPWDPQSKRQYGIDGVYATLNAGQAIGGQAHGICYAIEGNVVDAEHARPSRCGLHDRRHEQQQHEVFQSAQRNPRDEDRKVPGHLMP